MQSRARANKAGGRADAGEDGVMAKAEKVWRRRGEEEVGGGRRYEETVAVSLQKFPSSALRLPKGNEGCV